MYKKVCKRAVMNVDWEAVYDGVRLGEGEGETFEEWRAWKEDYGMILQEVWNGFARF